VVALEGVGKSDVGRQRGSETRFMSRLSYYPHLKPIYGYICHSSHARCGSRTPGVVYTWLWHCQKHSCSPLLTLVLQVPNVLNTYYSAQRTQRALCDRRGCRSLLVLSASPTRFFKCSARRTKKKIPEAIPMSFNEAGPPGKAATAPSGMGEGDTEL